MRPSKNRPFQIRSSQHIALLTLQILFNYSFSDLIIIPLIGPIVMAAAQVLLVQIMRIVTGEKERKRDAEIDRLERKRERKKKKCREMKIVRE